MLVEVLVGPIASGKSTYARKRAEMGAIIVNDDAIVSGLEGLYKFNKANKAIYKAAELSLINTAMVAGRDVIIDRPNMDPRTRRRYIGIAHAFDAAAIAVMFPNEGPGEHARRRFTCDARGLAFEHWLEAARRHQSLYQEPTLDEGFDNVLPYDVALEMAGSTAEDGID